MNSGKLIAHLWEEKGWSQTDLADKGHILSVIDGFIKSIKLKNIAAF